MLLSLLLPACNPPLDFTLTPDDDHAVAIITWESDAPVAARLEYRYPGSPPIFSRAEPEPLTAHRFRLAGVPPGKTVRWRAVWEEDGEEVQSAWSNWDATGVDMPLAAPAVKRSRSDDPGYYIVPDLQDQIIWILGPDGQPVWWKDLPENLTLERVRLRDDRLWYGTLDPSGGGLNTMLTWISSVGLDGAGETSETVYHHHDFLTFDDRLVYIQRVTGPGPDGKDWAGDQIVEQIDGVEHPIWSTFGTASFELFGDSQYREGLDWTHCNGLFYEPGEDAYWMSCKHQHAIFVVNRSGELLRIIGADISTLTLDGGGFGALHTPFVKDDRLYLFDNDRSTDASGDHPARAEVYQLDLDPDSDAGSYRLIDSHEDPDMDPWVHGNATPTQTGGMMVAFGSAGRLHVVDAEGDLTLDVNCNSSAYIEYLPTLSGPLD